MKKRLSLLLSLCLILAGCGNRGIPRGHVEGAISHRGEAIEEGFILFVPIPGVEGAPVQLKIKGGRYSSAKDDVDTRGVVIGDNDVEIVAMKATGKRVRAPDGTEIDEMIPAIPEKYNAKTELRRTVKAGKNQFDFNLE